MMEGILFLHHPCNPIMRFDAYPAWLLRGVVSIELHKTSIT